MKKNIILILIFTIVLTNIINTKFIFSNVVLMNNDKVVYSYNISIDDVSSAEASNVIEGKDGWLFFDPYLNDNVRADYLGLNLFTVDELNYYLNKLVEIKNKLQQKGIDFCIFLAPNKNRIYSEYYPSYIGEMSPAYRLQQFVEYISLNSDIKIVYPINEMLYTKNKFQSKIVYHKYDSHWNALGGYVGAYCLLKKFGIDIQDVQNIKIYEVEGNYYDLLDIKGLNRKDYQDIDYVVTYDGEPTTSTHVFKEDSIAAYASNKPIDDRRFLMCIDSYFAAMSKPMADVCNNIVSVMFTDFKKEYIDDYKPDIFVVEILERTLKNRLDHFILSMGEMK